MLLTGSMRAAATYHTIDEGMTEGAVVGEQPVDETVLLIRASFNEDARNCGQVLLWILHDVPAAAPALPQAFRRNALATNTRRKTLRV